MYDYTDYIHHGKKMLISTYSTKHLSNKDKVRFYYALKGRDGKSGLIKRLKIEYLGKTVLLVPARYEEDVQQFFQVWNLSYTKRKVIVDTNVQKRGVHH